MEVWLLHDAETDEVVTEVRGVPLEWQKSEAASTKQARTWEALLPSGDNRTFKPVRYVPLNEAT